MSTNTAIHECVGNGKSRDDASLDYNKIKEGLNELSLQVEFKMQGLLADDETKNQIGYWMSERSTTTNNSNSNNINPLTNTTTTITATTTNTNTNKKLPHMTNPAKANNTYGQCKNFFRNFNDWRSHLVFYKQMKGYNRPPLLDENKNASSDKAENTSLNSNNHNENESAASKPNYTVSVMNPNYKYNKHQITSENYLDQIKQIQSKIQQSVEGSNGNPLAALLPDVKKLPTIKLMSNSESEMLLQGTSNLPAGKKASLTKLQHLANTGGSLPITSSSNGAGSVPSISTVNTEVSLQVVNGVPRKIAQAVSEQQLAKPTNEFSASNVNNGVVANTNSDKVNGPTIHSAINGTLIHLKNRSTTPHKTITNIGFKMEHKAPPSSENSSANQKIIPYTKGRPCRCLDVFFRMGEEGISAQIHS